MDNPIVLYISVSEIEVFANKANILYFDRKSTFKMENQVALSFSVTNTK